MVCIYCGSDTKVVNSRPQKSLNSVWRRRLCVKCGGLFTTTESFQASGTFMLKKIDGNLAVFLREKLFLSVYDSCKHRDAAAPDSLAITDTIVNRLIHKHKNGVLDQLDLKDITYKTLNKFDRAASTHYKAYFMKVS